MGGARMRGEQSVDMRKLADQIKQQEKEATEGLGKRKFWDQFGDVAKMGYNLLTKSGPLGFLVPGSRLAQLAIGGVLDLLVDQISQKDISAGDPEKIKELETEWTEGLAGESASSLEEVVESSEETLTEGLLGQVKSGLKQYGASKVGDLFKGKETPGVEGDPTPPVTETSKIKEFSPEQLKRINKYKEENWNIFDKTRGNILTEENTLFSDWTQEELEASMEATGLFKKDGGIVPKYYGGGIVNNGESPTISDYFNMQGKSLGGSNKHSLATMLGRK